MFAQASFEQQVPAGLMPYYESIFPTPVTPASAPETLWPAPESGVAQISPSAQTYSSGPLPSELMPFYKNVQWGQGFSDYPLGLTGTTWLMILAAAGGAWWFMGKRKRRA